MDELKQEIYNALVKILKPYEKKLNMRTDRKCKYELSGKKKVVAWKREFESMFFAAVIIQKGFTGFYFFPIYTHVKEFKKLPDNLKKCLKGKSCFHIKKNDKDLFASIKEIVKQGFDIYKKSGWV